MGLLLLHLSLMFLITWSPPAISQILVAIAIIVAVPFGYVTLLISGFAHSSEGAIVCASVVGFCLWLNARLWAWVLTNVKWRRRKSRPQVRFDEQSIQLLNDTVVSWTVAWSAIERIGYRSTDDGPWQDDHFIVIRTKDVPPRYFDVSLSWQGALELSHHVDKMDGALLPKKGHLANCTDCRSVTVWPAIHSGEPI